jgi:hypothetical protein
VHNGEGSLQRREQKDHRNSLFRNPMDHGRNCSRRAETYFTSKQHTYVEERAEVKAGIDACLFLEGDINSEYREIRRELNKQINK